MEWYLMRKRCMVGATGAAGADITATEAGHGARTAITEVVMIETEGLGRTMTDAETGIQTEGIEAETVSGTGSVTGPEKKTGIEIEIEIDGIVDMTAIDGGNVAAFRQNNV